MYALVHKYLCSYRRALPHKTHAHIKIIEIFNGKWMRTNIHANINMHIHMPWNRITRWQCRPMIWYRKCWLTVLCLCAFVCVCVCNSSHAYMLIRATNSSSKKANKWPEKFLRQKMKLNSGQEAAHSTQHAERGRGGGGGDGSSGTWLWNYGEW